MPKRRPSSARKPPKWQWGCCHPKCSATSSAMDERSMQAGSSDATASHASTPTATDVSPPPRCCMICRACGVLETHFGVDEKPDPDELARMYGSLFVQFDHDANGSVDLEEFKAETRRMMLAMANDLGFLPVQMVLEEDSFLKKAVERELTKVPA
ncbi:hypothetical protein NL676_000632 [Syzygium grande]|nr:hypothetical protein NL676_000632 [Syzygium grande]